MRISTVFVIIALVVISSYALIEVGYYSNKIAAEDNISSPMIEIPKIGVNEKINNVSISQGVFHEEQSFLPSKGEVILFGHRTSFGSPFLFLDQLKSNDNVILLWPDIGEVTYTVNKSYVVSPYYHMNVNQSSQKLYLITCTPIGTTKERLIVECDMASLKPLTKDKKLKEIPNKNYGIYIMIAFLSIGLIFAYFYPKEDRIYIFATIIILFFILLLAYIFKLPPDIVSSKIYYLDNFFSF